MNRIRLILTVILLSACVAGGLSGCLGESTPTPLPAPTATPVPPTDTPEPPTPTTAPPSPTTASASSGTLTGPAADLLTKAQAAMQALKTYHFVIEVTSAEGVTVSGEGDVQTPDKVRITLDLGQAGKSQMLVLGQDVYLQQPGTQTFIPISRSGSAAAGMGLLGNPQQVTSFAQLADSANIVGDEQIDGVDTTHVQFTYDLSKVGQTAGATTSAGQATGDMWIEKSSGYARRVKIITPATTQTRQTPSGTGGTSAVVITYSRFDVPLAAPIEKPANITNLPGTLVGTPTP